MKSMIGCGAVLAAMVLAQPPKDDVLQVQRLEIVDEQGQPLMVLGAMGTQTGVFIVGPELKTGASLTWGGQAGASLELMDGAGRRRLHAAGGTGGAFGLALMEPERPEPGVTLQSSASGNIVAVHGDARPEVVLLWDYSHGRPTVLAGEQVLAGAP